MTCVRGTHGTWLESATARGAGPNGWIEPAGAMRAARRAGRGACRTPRVCERAGADRAPVRATRDATGYVEGAPFTARAVTVELWVRGRFERRAAASPTQR